MVPGILEFKVLQSDDRIFRDEYPGTLHEIGPHPRIATPRDPALACLFPCRVFGRSEPDE